MAESVQPEKPSPPTDQNLPHPVLLLINGNSRTGRQQFGEAISLLRDNGVEVKEAILARDRAETERLLKREIAEKANLVIVGGGDGTLSTCAEYLAGNEVAMGVLPLGTGNTFARSIGLPVDLKGAIETIANGRVERIDVGKCNDQVFLNSVSIGLSAEIAGALTGDIKKKLGLLAWPVIGGRVALSHRAVRLRLTSDKGVETFRTHQLMVANGRYVAGPIRASEDASLQDNELTVFALGGESKLELVSAAWKWMRDSHIDAEEVPFFETKELKVESMGRRLKANVDGEINEVTPLHLKVWARALRVVVPRDFIADAV
ncbi:YegS/Rv2252/BmrU family lipid kinase [bacterium]|nr:MAG: YegS/Rv2252/BmrU family lipid kinase [bacterium]